MRHGVERIKTVGDTYLAVTGPLATAARSHAPHGRVRAARRARSCADFNREKNAHLGLTVGIGSGPVVADVMGQGQFLFQLWGAAVIAADHAMDCGDVNDIVVTRSVRDGLADQYTFEAAADVDVRRPAVDARRPWLSCSQPTGSSGASA